MALMICSATFLLLSSHCFIEFLCFIKILTQFCRDSTWFFKSLVSWHLVSLGSDDMFCYLVFIVSLCFLCFTIVLWRFDMIFKNLYLRKKSCFLTSCFLTFLLKMRNKLNHALSHHQMVVNNNSSVFLCQKF